MKPLEVARAEILTSIPRLGSEQVPLTESLGMVVSEPAIVREALPPFDNSAMDGFAVVAEDVASTPVELTVIEDVPAGAVPKLRVESGSATRIMTGAPMPEGADAVVRVEDTVSSGSGSVVISASAVPGQNVRRAGSDMTPGDVIVEPGTRLTSLHLASLASAGVDPVVARMPRVAILSTGDEIVDPSTKTLRRGTIRDSNRVLLRSVLSDLGVPIVDVGIVGDDPDALRAAYAEAASRADVVVSTGGVSMGDFDYVKQILGDLGSVEFWRVAMQPGKPFAFGTIDGVPLFGLPGNPVSTFVSFEQFVRPALLHMMGATHLLRTRINATMGEDVETSEARVVFLRVVLSRSGDGSLVAKRSGGQGSHMHSSLAGAEAFAVIPVGTGSLSAGDDVTLEMFTWPEGRRIDD